MAVATQSPDSPQPVGDPHLTVESLQKFAPLARLLTAIAAVPQVSKISVTVIPGSVDLWVFMLEEDYEAEGQISLAERVFLNSGRAQGFMLHVIPGDDVSPEILPPNTVLFER
jgi:hypothetical protein